MTRRELINQIFNKFTFLCVGLDADIDKLPLHLRGNIDAIFPFNKAIIDATADYCVAYKPNTAFYECLGTTGWRILEETVRYIKNRYPQHLIIADAKRGDIGNTSKMYAKAFFDVLKADAITVAPYMGRDSVSPFLERKDKWTVLLGLTSNKGAEDFQFDKTDANDFLFEDVIIKSKEWGEPDNLMYVVGATQASQLKRIRELVPNHFLLVPGVGAQGGELKEVVINGFNSDCGILVNASRSIIYASEGEDFAVRAAFKAKEMADEMSTLIHQYLPLRNS